MELRKATKKEFNKWFKESSIRHAQDRAFMNNTTEEAELKNVEQMTEMMLPEGMHTANHYFYVLDDQDYQNIGFIWFGKVPDIAQEDIVLLDIMIDENHRQKGYGRNMLILGQNQMKEAGYSRVLLNVMERNFAKHLYASMGYVTVKQMDDHKIMALEL